MSISRRGFLAGLSAGALVVGFDVRSRRWIKSADAACGSWPHLERIPALTGTLHTDLPTRTAEANDKGNLVTRVPAAVLRPGSIDDIAAMVRFCRKHDIEVAARGQHHTMHGQSLTCGLQIDMTSLATIHSITPSSAVVDAGVKWHDLYAATFPQGLRPVTTGYTNLSVGGTLSVGGCPLSNDKGALVDRIRELVVVTGKGDVVTCSPAANSDLFDAALGGLGQCGIIARATVDLLPAKSRARTYLLHYTQAQAPRFWADFRLLAKRGELDEVYTVCIPPGSSTFTYEINATVFYDVPALPNDVELLRGTQGVPTVTDQPYLDYAFFVDNQVATLQAAGWDALVKPWFDVWVPDSAAEPYVTSTVANLTLEDVGTGGFVLLFMQKRSAMTRPYFRLPEGDDWIVLFDICTTSAVPGVSLDPTFAQRMLARNRTLYDQAVAIGGTRYPIGALDFTHGDWQAHYGATWNAFKSCKHRYDPDGILTPGPAIF